MLGSAAEPAPVRCLQIYNIFTITVKMSHWHFGDETASPCRQAFTLTALAWHWLGTLYRSLMIFILYSEWLMYRHYWFCKSGTLIHEYYLNLYTNGSLPNGYLPGSTQPGSTKSQSFAWMEPLTFADVLTKRSGSVGFTTEKVGPDHGTFHLSVLRY